MFASAIEREPAYREGYYLLAVDDHQQGRFEAADARLRILLDDPKRFAGTTSYLNWLAVYELACSNTLALGEHQRILELERSAARRNAAIPRVPTFRTCVGQAVNALGRTEEALEIYRGVARDLGSATPPQLHVMITRNLIKLGRREEALEWFEIARVASRDRLDLERQLERLSERLRKLPRSGDQDPASATGSSQPQPR